MQKTPTTTPVGTIERAMRYARASLQIKSAAGVLSAIAQIRGKYPQLSASEIGHALATTFGRRPAPVQRAHEITQAAIARAMKGSK